HAVFFRLQQQAAAVHPERATPARGDPGGERAPPPFEETARPRPPGEVAAEPVAQWLQRGDAPSSQRNGVHAEPCNPLPPLRTTTRSTAVRPRTRARLSILYVPLLSATSGWPVVNCGGAAPLSGVQASRIARTDSGS